MDFFILWLILSWFLVSIFVAVITTVIWEFIKSKFEDEDRNENEFEDFFYEDNDEDIRRIFVKRYKAHLYVKSVMNYQFAAEAA